MLVITNAIYFKGEWQEPFPECMTCDRQFHLLNSVGCLTVPMMQATWMLPYYESEQFAMVEIPYQGDSVGMFLVLPNQNTSDQLMQVSSPSLYAA